MQPNYLMISVRFLLDEFHGRGDQGKPEWPPSPLRLFQALVNTSARQGTAEADRVLEWIERQPAPAIVATPPAAIQPRSDFKSFVPDNVGDLVAKSWSGGKENDISNYRIAKEIRSTRLPEDAVVRYLWPFTDAATVDLPGCKRMACAISAFGWGIDLVVVDAALIPQEESDALTGERWLPSETRGSVSLRVPTQGTLADLHARYEAFFNRISLENDAVFRPVPPLAAYVVRDYRKSSEMARPPCAVFDLRKPDDTAFASFATARKGLHLGGMMRYCAAQIAPQMGWDEKRVAEFVLGHGESRGESHRPVDGPRLVFMPLPSIEYQGGTKGRAIGSIRRVLVTVSGSIPASEFNAIVRALEGQELIDENTQAVVAFLRRVSTRSDAIADYFAQGRAWATVTPVVLPGHDDPRKLRRRLNEAMLSPREKAAVVEKLECRIESLLRKAMQQAGVSAEVASAAEIQWRGTGFLTGTSMASDYAVPEQHRRFRRLHCRIVFRNPVAGPVCLGGGRHFGLGLFAAVPEDCAPQKGE